MIEKVNLQEKFGLFEDLWSPMIISEMNDSYVKLAKLKGEFVWHDHENEDELFYVIDGDLNIKLRDGDVHLSAGEMIVIPSGLEHKPVAKEEVQVMLIELKSTKHTGHVESNLTKSEKEWI